MELDLAVLRGDGVGPAVWTRALKRLQGLDERFGQSFDLNEGIVGGVAIDTLGEALSYGTLFMYDCRMYEGRVGEMSSVECAKAEAGRRIIWDLG